ncbi:MAG: ribonuclease HII [Clostridiales bacterium]|nr:ribonuclease HII [Clostridiales bacterium]
MREYEEELLRNGVRYIAGIDEVGRGPLAGPVVAAAVVLPADFSVQGVNDSKKLTAKKREELFPLILGQALAWGIGAVDNLTIDRINILEATKAAMRMAACEAGANLAARCGAGVEHLLIDAVALKSVGIPQTSIIRGDEKSVSIAAASIVAKVARDSMMVGFHSVYPHYCFDRNKGYGTKAHYEGIERFGICEIHRRSFLGGEFVVCSW